MQTKTLNLINLRSLFCTLVVSLFLPNYNYGQIKKNLSFEIGSGYLLARQNIEKSKYNSMYNNPVPKIFFGLNYFKAINTKTMVDLGAVFNYSRFENRLQFLSNNSEFIFNSSLFHKDLNYGVSIGLKRKIQNEKIIHSVNGGIKFQKIAVNTLGYAYNFESKGTDTSTYTFTENLKSNYIEKDENSMGYYVSWGIKPQKRKLELLVELTGTINKPYYFSNEIYYQGDAIEKTSYRTNFHYGVIKLRRYF